MEGCTDESQERRLVDDGVIRHAGRDRPGQVGGFEEEAKATGARSGRATDRRVRRRETSKARPSTSSARRELRARDERRNGQGVSRGKGQRPAPTASPGVTRTGFQQVSGLPDAQAPGRAPRVPKTTPTSRKLRAATRERDAQCRLLLEPLKGRPPDAS